MCCLDPSSSEPLAWLNLSFLWLAGHSGALSSGWRRAGTLTGFQFPLFRNQGMDQSCGCQIRLLTGIIWEPPRNTGSQASPDAFSVWISGVQPRNLRLPTPPHDSEVLSGLAGPQLEMLHVWIASCQWLCRPSG